MGKIIAQVTSSKLEINSRTKCDVDFTIPKIAPNPVIAPPPMTKPKPYRKPLPDDSPFKIKKPKINPTPKGFKKNKKKFLSFVTIIFYNRIQAN